MTSWFEPMPLVESDPVFQPDAGFVPPIDEGFREPGPVTGRTPSEEAAYQEGVVAGRESAPWAEIERVTTLVGELERTLDGVVALRRDQLESGRRFAIELAVSLVEGLLRRELSGDPASLEGAIAQALASFDSPEESLELALSPADHAVFERLRNESDDTTELPRTLPIKADPSLGRGCAELRDGAEIARVDPEEFGERLRRELLPLLRREEEPEDNDGGEPSCT